MIAEIARKLDADERLSDADALELLSATDLIGVVELADRARRRRHNVQATFVRVQRIPLTGEPPAIAPQAGELQIVGRPSTLDAALAGLRSVLASAGDVPVSAFELSALDELAAEEGITLRTLLERLREAGLELVAEASFDRLANPVRAVEAVNMAGLVLARLTLEAIPRGGLVRAFRDIAALQRQVGVLRAVQPLVRGGSAGEPATGYADLRQVALARLLVDNVESIQIDWSTHGPKLAQVALTAGADDLDQVPAGAAAGPRGRSGADEVRANIEAAGLVALERNGRFDLC